MEFLAKIADHELLQKLVECKNPTNLTTVKAEIERRISQVTQADTYLIDHIITLEQAMKAIDSDLIEPTEEMRKLSLNSFAAKQQLLERMSGAKTATAVEST